MGSYGEIMIAAPLPCLLHVVIVHAAGSMNMCRRSCESNIGACLCLFMRELPAILQQPCQVYFGIAAR